MYEDVSRARSRVPRPGRWGFPPPEAPGALRACVVRGVQLGVRVTIALEIAVGVLLIVMHWSLLLLGFEGLDGLFAAVALVVGVLLTGVGLVVGGLVGAAWWCWQSAELARRTRPPSSRQS